MFQTFFLIAITAVFTFLNLSFEFSQPKVIKKPVLSENKGIYLTANTAASAKGLQNLIDLADKTELNSMVIDLKDYSGRIFIDAEISLADEIGSKKLLLRNIQSILKKLKDKGIYTVARIAVFQDPYLAEHKPEIALKSKTTGGLWRDFKGLAWADPAAKIVWDYNLRLAEAAAQLGFDEINFDYIRFPSDGVIADIVYPIFDERNKTKSQLMKDFFRYASARLSFYPIATSIDLFGMTLWRNDGLNIGQRLEDAAPYFDYISPMVYPSHYPDGFQGFKNPAQYPYEIIYQSLIRFKEIKSQRARLRPWLQDFDLGAEYTPAMIRQEMKAALDASSTGWFLWNAKNVYTEGALD